MWFGYTSAMIITIDGPAGSGKSTAARNLAKALGIAYLDTGATYRALTLKALREGIDMADESALAELARQTDLKLIPEAEGVRVLMDGHDVSREIRSSQVSNNSHHAARLPEVREVLVGLQRRIGAELGNFVSEGRDQGSVVFPDADVKFYLNASADVRARRRCADLETNGEKADFEQVRKAILARDHRDRTRAVAPLIKPEGAIEINTDENTMAQTAAMLLAHVEAVR